LLVVVARSELGHPVLRVPFAVDARFQQASGYEQVGVLPRFLTICLGRPEVDEDPDLRDAEDALARRGASGLDHPRE
jgi:hypothetical protein